MLVFPMYPMEVYVHVMVFKPLSPLQVFSTMISYSCRYFWARKMPKSHVPLSCRSLNSFLIGCQVKYEMAGFNMNIKKMFDLLKYITSSDREGWWWLLHVSCMKIFLGNFFHEFGVSRSQSLGRKTQHPIRVSRYQRL